MAGTESLDDDAGGVELDAEVRAFFAFFCGGRGAVGPPRRADGSSLGRTASPPSDLGFITARKSAFCLSSCTVEREISRAYT